MIESKVDQLPPACIREWFTSRKCTIRFDRGGSFGVAEYELTSGAYQFVLTDRRLELCAKSFAITLDNTRNATEFNFVLSDRYVTAKELRSEVSEEFSSTDRQEVIPAGQTKTFTTRFPLVITFDRGDGRQPARRRLCDGTFCVGVTQTTNLIDVFPSSPGSSAVPPNSLSGGRPSNTTPPAAPSSARVLPPAPAPEPAPTMTAASN
jgi:hypothetical protein